MEVCLGFIAFEVGGALKWSKIKQHKREIINITIMASIFPYLIIVSGIYIIASMIPGLLPFGSLTLLLIALPLGALASPTEPATTIAVIHQYKAKGKVTDTIMGVAALDDVLGILLFSLTIEITSILNGGEPGLFGNALLNPLYQIVLAIMVGMVMAYFLKLIANSFLITSGGQWIIIIASLILLNYGVSQFLQVDELLASMTMGAVIVNTCKKQQTIFMIIERYTEDLVFLIFFLFSGLNLNIATIPQATLLIGLYVLFRTLGKFIGANVGARIAEADRTIQKYTAGGLLPQGGIVIGLVLSIYQRPVFGDVADLLLTTTMGATIVHELIGPIGAKYSLIKSGEIEKHKNNHAEPK
jgi:NhaP-type Na+/H+ or K+/H+ antiporter